MDNWCLLRRMCCKQAVPLPARIRDLGMMSRCWEDGLGCSQDYRCWTKCWRMPKKRWPQRRVSASWLVDCLRRVDIQEGMFISKLDINGEDSSLYQRLRCFDSSARTTQDAWPVARSFLYRYRQVCFSKSTYRQAIRTCYCQALCALYDLWPRMSA